MVLTTPAETSPSPGALIVTEVLVVRNNDGYGSRIWFPRGNVSGNRSGNGGGNGRDNDISIRSGDGSENCSFTVVGGNVDGTVNSNGSGIGTGTGRGTCGR